MVSQPQAGTVENVRRAHRAEATVDKTKTSEERRLEQNDGGNGPRKKFPHHENFAAHRRQKREMQGAFHHFAAKQPAENAHAGEKESEPHVVELDDSGQNLCVFLERRSIGGSGEVGEAVHQGHQRRRKGE